MVSGELAFLVVAHRRRRGSCGSPRGANRLIADAVATTRRLPDMEDRKSLLWSDSAYYGHPSISAEFTAGADVSVTARMTSTVNEDTGRWISSAEVTEIPFTAFASKNKTHQVPDRLAVRRIPELNKKGAVAKLGQ